MASTFDINAKATSDDGIYGLPFTQKEAEVIYFPVPFDTTTSYQAGTSKGPRAILKASEQIDFFDLKYIDAYQVGLYMQKEKASIIKLNKEGRPLALEIINASEEEVSHSKKLQAKLKRVNDISEMLNKIVYQETKALLKLKKKPIVIGGDHSTPFGAIAAYAEEYKNLGVLHIDAHSDTREAYMGFKYSHASIIFNVLHSIKSIKKIVQVGIRDFCEAEYKIMSSNKKMETFFDQEIAERKIHGDSFAKIAKEIISKLPENIYLTLDIDGLDSKYCPHTGTPVPGGLSYNEIIYLLEEIIRSKKTLVGFDLVEVTPSSLKSDEWDANVGMRLLYKITSIMLASQKKIKIRK